MNLCRWLCLSAVLLAGCGGGGSQITTGGGTPEELLARGADEAGRFNWDAATTLFMAAEQAAVPGSALHLRATYARAVAAHQRLPASAATIAEAERLYREVIATAPTSVEAGRATFVLGQIAETADYFRDVENLPAARELYQRVVDGWEGQESASLAILSLADAWAATLKPEDTRRGCELLEAWLAKHPDDPYAVVDWQWLGTAWHMGLGDSARAVDCLRRADALGLVPNGRQHEVLWRIARLAERDLHDNALAIDYFTRLIVERPSSGKSWEAQQRLRALGIEPPPITLYDREAVKRAQAAARAGKGETPAPPSPVAPSPEAAP